MVVLIKLAVLVVFVVVFVAQSLLSGPWHDHVDYSNDVATFVKLLYRLQSTTFDYSIALGG